MKRKALLIIILLGIVGFCLVWRALRKREIKFYEICRIKCDTEFRLNDGSFFDPQGWVWYSISEDPYSGFDTREIDDYIIANNITLDMEKYTYIVIKGYILDEMYVKLMNSKSWDEHFRKWIGYVRLSPKCDSHEMVLYKIDKQFIVPSSQFKSSPPFVHILRDK